MVDIDASKSKELKNIKVSIRAHEVMKKLVEDGYFSDGKSAYIACIFLALKNNLQDNPRVSPKQFTENKWDTSAVFYDSDTRVKELLSLLHPDVEDIIAFGQDLAEKGLEFVDFQRLSGGEILPLFSSLEE
jgi:hypothetical protein